MPTQLDCWVPSVTQGSDARNMCLRLSESEMNPSSPGQFADSDANATPVALIISRKRWKMLGHKIRRRRKKL